MKRESLIMAVVVVLLVGVTSAFLARLKNNQRLGEPGVRIVQSPMFDEDGTEVSPQRVVLPSGVPGYEANPGPVMKAELEWLPPDTTYGRQFYRMPDRFEAMISVVVMGTDRGSIHKPEICLTGQGWSIDRADSGLETIRIERPHPYDLEVMKLVGSKSVELTNGQIQTWRAVYLYWFVADGALTPHHGERMWWMARDLVQHGVLQRWAYVGVFAACPPGREDETFRRLSGLVAETVPEFQRTSGPAQIARN